MWEAGSCVYPFCESVEVLPTGEQLAKMAEGRLNLLRLARSSLISNACLLIVVNHRRRNAMPLYMDIHHKIEGLTADAVMHAHEADVQTQEKYDVKYLKYWFDEGSGKVFCLVEAPTREAAATVHHEAHGLEADEIIEVQEGV
jgi:uncharacterized protein DUF4242